MTTIHRCGACGRPVALYDEDQAPVEPELLRCTWCAAELADLGEPDGSADPPRRGADGGIDRGEGDV